MTASNGAPGAPIPLDSQIRCVEREIRQRLRVYPRLVERGTMKRHEADYEIEAMQSVLATLKRLQGPAPEQPPLL